MLTSDSLPSHAYMHDHAVSRRGFVAASAVALFSSVGLLAGCGADTSQESGTDANPLGLVTPGVLTVGSDCDYPPFIQMDGSNPIGFEFDLLAAICEKLELELHYLPPQKFDTLLASIGTGGIMDVTVSSITITEDRKKAVAFTAPYYDSNQSIVVMKDSGIASVSDLTGATIACQAGTTGEAWAKENIPGAQMMPLDDASSSFAAVVAGKAQALALDLPVAAQFIKSSYPDCVMIEQIPTGEQYAMAVALANAPLLAALDSSLKELREDGTIAQISERWLEL